MALASGVTALHGSVRRSVGERAMRTLILCAALSLYTPTSSAISLLPEVYIEEVTFHPSSPELQDALKDREFSLVTILQPQPTAQLCEDLLSFRDPMKTHYVDQQDFAIVLMRAVERWSTQSYIRRDQIEY